MTVKLSRDFLYHESNGEVYLVPSGNAEFSGVVKGNKTFGEILGLLMEDTTEQQIIDTLRKEYDDAPEGMIERDVRKAVENLRSVGAIE
ncbi:MAG: PqqD family protein [Synergistaceae bacterium]|nr:PqqD family protein [Synergistaceae bacterium]